MSSLQRRIIIVTDTTAYLIAQLRELDQLRSQVRQARLSAQRTPPTKRRKRNGETTRSRPVPAIDHDGSRARYL
jgi:hypothetical protein